MYVCMYCGPKLQGNIQKYLIVNSLCTENVLLKSLTEFSLHHMMFNPDVF